MKHIIHVGIGLCIEKDAKKKNKPFYGSIKSYLIVGVNFMLNITHFNPRPGVFIISISG